MTTLKGKTIFITGSSRGIGRAIALRAARDGARVVIAAKSDSPHPKLPGTIHTVAREVIEAGGEALPVAADIRDDAAIERAVSLAVERFGGVDIVVNNASALNLSKTPDLPMRRFDLMFDINVRGTFAVTKACLPHLRHAVNPHVLTLSPPLNLVPSWFGEHCGYTMSKYAMSMIVLGLAEEFRSDGIAVNALWPHTMIETAASGVLGVPAAGCRSPDIVADAAHSILIRDSQTCTGNFFIDEDVLRDAGIPDFERYSIVRGAPLRPDLFIREQSTPAS